MSALKIHHLLGVVILVILVTYIVSYYVMVEVEHAAIETVILPHPEYVVRGEFIRTAFRPVHYFDRRLRPQVWKAKVKSRNGALLPAPLFDELLEPTY